MLTASLLVASLAAAAAASVSGPYRALNKRQSTNTSTPAPAVVDATYDGSCFYPKPVDDFVLEEYLGRWYQVAGTLARFTAGCKCTVADYALNENGTVNVQNGCEINGTQIPIQGTATPVSPSAGYGQGGVLRVQFPGQPAPDCPGPNYIVQDIGLSADEDCHDDDVSAADDNAFAIVQTNNFTTLFLLSRNRNPSNASIEAWLERARMQGSNLDNVAVTDQTGCQFT